MREPRPIVPEQIRAILFDLDGTLIESDDHWVGQLANRLEVLQRLSRRIDPGILARRLVMISETPSNYLLSAMEHLGISTRFFGLTDRIRKARGLATKELSNTVQGSERLLELLRQKFRLGVVTTRGRAEALAFLDQSGLRHYFPVVVTRQDVLRMKPHREPVCTAARLLGVAPEACIMIGDTINDVLAARRAGAYAIGVLSGFGERHELERSGADVILDYAVDMLELPEWEALRDMVEEQQRDTPVDDVSP